MNLVQRIANSIEQRVTTLQRHGALPKKGKKLDDYNYELWTGAYIGIVANGTDTKTDEWLQRVIVLLVGTRGYSETQELAKSGRDADAAEVEREIEETEASL